jgi:hypothetical protein
MYRLLIALAIMVVWFMTPVQAFEIGPPSNCNPSLLQVPSLTGPCGRIITDFGEPQHQNITMQALCNTKAIQNNICPPSSGATNTAPGLGGTGTTFFYQSPSGAVYFNLKAITDIQDGNAYADGYQYIPSVHFDDAGITAGSNRVIQGKQKLIAMLAQSPPINAHKFRYLFGSYLHTVQDFYAHSNFANNNSSGMANLGNVPYMNPAPGLYPCGFGLGEALIPPSVNYLTSGWASGKPLNINTMAPAGQCAHGPPSGICFTGNNLLPPGSPPCLSAGMNHDDHLRPLFAQAYNAAVTDTIQFATDVLTAPSNIADNVCMVMTDERCPISTTTYIYNGPRFTYTIGAIPGAGPNLTGTVTFNIDTSSLTGWYGAPFVPGIGLPPPPIISNPIKDVTLQSGVYSETLSSSSPTNGPVFYFQNGIITGWFIDLYSRSIHLYTVKNFYLSNYLDEDQIIILPSGIFGETGERLGAGSWTRQ